MNAAPPDRASAKRLGAFYTRAEVAQFLVKWAIRSKSETVLDPSSGGGVFLRAACDHIKHLGASPAASVFGIELDPLAHAAATVSLASDGLPAANLIRDDFFAVFLNRIGRFDVLVGNPPFIRYQQFNGAARNRATDLMRHLGVRVSELASSWAPFIVCGAQLLKQGGRLAMVIPMELCHASYAIPVLEYLGRSFRSVQLISFAERLFPDLSQETLLLLADDKGDHRAEFRWRHLPDSAALSKVDSDRPLRGARRLETSAFAEGRQRLIEHFLPAKTRTLYGEIRGHESVQSLGAVADVGIGYVTGANEFFHLSPADAGHWEIPAQFLQPAVCRGRALTGLHFTEDDWKAAVADKSAAYLLQVPRHEKLPTSVRRYIRHGEATEIHTAYKCRVRDPWYHVPHVHRADAFLTYMSGISPRLVANHASAVAPNTLHVVRMLPLASATADALALSWRTSLTELSAEIEGHALGGGMLKLEPTEAGRVLLALPPGGDWNGQCQVLDRLARHVGAETVRATVDRLWLRDHLGLSDKDCRRLREAAAVLRARRLGRSC